MGRGVLYIGLMTLLHIGRLIADRRRAKGLTLSALATRASVGRSTLAALESGKLKELGLTRVARICSVVDLTIDIRPHQLEAPIMLHRHLIEAASRELSHAATDDIVTRGTAAALHVRHRYSLAHDHVLENLSANCGNVTCELKSIVGWRINRRIKNKLVLGRVDTLTRVYAINDAQRRLTLLWWSYPGVRT